MTSSRPLRRAVALGLVTLSASVASIGCSSGTPESTDASAKLSPREAVAAAALVLDVRTKDEFDAGHLDRATNIPVDEVASRVEEIAAMVGGDRSKPIAVYCASGGRAGRALTTLQKAGFTQVTNAGGYAGLK